MDVDGHGNRDIDPSRVYLAGFSYGSLTGMLAAAIEPRIRATVLVSPDGSLVPGLAPGARGVVGTVLRDRMPPLLNPPGTQLISNLGGINVAAPLFNEKAPARGEPPLVNDVPGAIAIQDFFERVEWLQGNAGPNAFAAYVRSKPLSGVPVRPFLMQVARGDRSDVNPSLYRHDLFVQRQTLPDPHTFAIRVDQAAMRSIALMAQDQIAEFFNTDGALTIDPDGAGELFEVPVASPALLETYGFIF